MNSPKPLAALPLLICLSLPPAAVGQSFYGGRESPAERRQARERAVARVGAEARSLVESDFGDEAVAALSALSLPSAKRLAVWHSEGGLARLHRPADFLSVLARSRSADSVLLFAVANSDRLADPDAFNCFLGDDPTEYALHLKKLDRGAAEYRARRLAREAAGAKWWADWRDWRVLTLAGALAVALGLVIVAKRRRAGAAAP